MGDTLLQGSPQNKRVWPQDNHLCDPGYTRGYLHTVLNNHRLLTIKPYQ